MLDWKQEWKPLAWIVGAFLFAFYLPIGNARFETALGEALRLVQWYAREHVILCLIPAFFIAGAIAVFVSQASVLKYFGAQTKKVLSYGIASVSGTILAVCSCTVLPIFAGIYRVGSGLGPAVAFLYSGPAINVLAIVMTARILGIELGIARAVGAILFSVVIGLFMQWIFRKEEAQKQSQAMHLPSGGSGRSLRQNALFFALLVLILIFATWGKPADGIVNFWSVIYAFKWVFTGISAIGLGVLLVRWFQISRVLVLLLSIVVFLFALLFPDKPLLSFSIGILGLSFLLAPRSDEGGEWFAQSWGFAKQIMPLLLGGVFVAGFLLGRPEGGEGMIPAVWVQQAVGGNGLGANLFASVAGALMYFATLTEVPILQGLMNSGMGKGPALALLLAGPALSLPSMLVLRSIMGLKKTVVYCLLVVVMSTISGLIYGNFL